MKTFRIFLPSFLLFFFVSNSYAQNADSLYIENLIEQAKRLSPQQKDSALKLVNEADIKAVENGFTDLEAVCYYTKASIFEDANDLTNAEMFYLLWLELRKQQSSEKHRWALRGVQGFYKRQKNIQKLDEINWALISSLKKDYCNDQSPANCESEFRSALDNIIYTMVSIGAYPQAEAYFNHAAAFSDDEPSWYSSSLVYFRIEKKLAEKNDSAGLASLYDRWFKAIQEHSTDSNALIKSIITISSVKCNRNEKLQPRIHLFESAYPHITENQQMVLIQRQIKTSLYRTYQPDSEAFLIYLNIKRGEILNNPDYSKKVIQPLFKMLSKERDSLKINTKKDLIYVLEHYGTTSTSNDIKKASTKLLKKLTS